MLVYLENNGSKLPKTSLSAIRAALEIKKAFGLSKAVGFLCGKAGVEEAAKQAAKFGLDEVVFLESDQLENGLALPLSEAILTLARELSTTVILAASTSRGKDVMPRVAQALEAGQASDVIAINGDQTFRRPMYAGNIIATVQLLTDKKAVTIRPAAFDPADAVATPCNVRSLSGGPSKNTSQEFVSRESVKSERPELGEAEIVVSGGRALKSAENFQKLLAPLADVLGAALGASRAAVDAGYAPNDWQVGQTGKVVAPKLYIAVGISGAIQHLAGMKDSKVIVAINQDSEAPIFEIADYGLVGDLYQILPELTEAIRKVKGQ